MGKNDRMEIISRQMIHVQTLVTCIVCASMCVGIVLARNCYEMLRRKREKDIDGEWKLKSRRNQEEYIYTHF